MTGAANREIFRTSFCCSCGKPVRWVVRSTDKKCNEEFCDDCMSYAAKIVQLELRIEEIELLSHQGKNSDTMAQVEVEKLVKERDVNIRILDTIRAGMTGWFEKASMENRYLKDAKIRN